jgi:hypothetical protein
MTRFRSVVLVSLILIASTAAATADDLQVNLMLRPCECSFGPGDMGSSAYGYADFTSIAPWTINFATGDALSWQQGDTFYYATFGRGGFFDMTGPAGLTFTGVVDSGQSGYEYFSVFVDVTFSGQWSNGVYGYGDAELYFNNAAYESDLNAYVAPEPSSLGLMGAGVLGIWGGRKRLWRKMNIS